MDIGIVLGLLVGVGSIAAALVMDESPFGAYLNATAGIIVIGGSIGATIASVPLQTVLVSPALMLKAIFKLRGCSSRKFIEDCAAYSQIVRREGMLALEKKLDQQSDPFVRKALQLVIDGLDGNTIIQILESDVDAMQKRHKANYNMFFTLAAYAPTMGILGTVLGLIAMLMGLGDTTEGLGQAVAVAFLTTLYGVFLANLVFLPVATNLKAKSDEEVTFRRVVVEGVLALQTGENPRLLKDKLMAAAGLAKAVTAEAAV